jgi:voltage-gated potassium channel
MTTDEVAARRRWFTSGRDGRTRLERWELTFDETLIAAAVVFIVAYALPILWRRAPAWVVTSCDLSGKVIWALFAVDLAVRVSLSGRPLRYLRGHWLDAIAVALPMFRPLRALRAVIAIDVLTHNSKGLTRGRVVTSVSLTTGSACLLAAVAVLDAERANPQANIASFGDALWWSLCTVTTIGYGDRFPTTNEGRVVGIALMMTGIGLIGVVTAAVASWFVQHLGAVTEVETATAADVHALLTEVRALREQVAALAPELADPPG